jgi:hypothetical protein
MAWRRNVARFTTRQLREGWRAVLFVPALIFILEQFQWLHVIDDYAFVAIANNAAIADLVEGRLSRTSEDNGVVVALIDSETHAQRYSARSPLNRCELFKDISLLYEASPQVLAIDIDISPAPGLTRSRPAPRRGATRTQGDCEYELYALIKRQDPEVTRTVLMAPAREIGDKVRGRVCAWQADMLASGVEFGGADLRVNNGMTLEQSDDERTFGAAVHRARKQEQLTGAQRDVLLHECTSAAQPAQPAGRSKRINALLYGSSICPVPLKVKGAAAQQTSREDGLGSETQCPASTTAGPGEFSTRLNAALKPVRPRILFFGAGYGEDDVFFTPVGMLYGVEVHAAAYLSRLHPIDEKEWISLTGDILIAFLFSFSISFCWQQYFRNRMSGRARDRELAAWWVIMLLAVFAVLVYVTCVVSFLAMRGAGIWLSPVPIAIGMLLDAFVLGSVHVAIDTRRDQVNAAVRALQAAPPESFATVASTILEQGRREAVSLADSINTGQYVAGAMIFMRRAVWLGVIGAAAAIVVQHSLT